MEQQSLTREPASASLPSLPLTSEWPRGDKHSRCPDAHSRCSCTSLTNPPPPSKFKSSRKFSIVVAANGTTTPLTSVCPGVSYNLKVGRAEVPCILHLPHYDLSRCPVPLPSPHAPPVLPHLSFTSSFSARQVSYGGLRYHHIVTVPTGFSFATPYDKAWCVPCPCLPLPQQHAASGSEVS